MACAKNAVQDTENLLTTAGIHMYYICMCIYWYIGGTEHNGAAAVLYVGEDDTRELEEYPYEN